MNKNIINIGFMAHVDAGKTTLVEHILYAAGVTKDIGKVDEGSSATDTLRLEKKRGISINATTISCYWNHVKINIVDTPGHRDFISEVNRTFQVLDLAVLLISANDGIQAQTIFLFQSLVKQQIPVVFFINKIDQVGVDLEDIYAQIKTTLTSSFFACQQIHLNDTKSVLVDTLSFEDLFFDIVECNDTLLEAYVNNQLSPQTLPESLLEVFAAAELFPVFHGVALEGIGVVELLNFLSFVGKHTKQPPNKSLSAHVYAIKRMNRDNKYTYIKVDGGTLLSRSKYPLVRENAEILDVSIHHLYALEAGDYIPADYILANDIGILINDGSLQIGDYIGEQVTSFTNHQLPIFPIDVSVRPENIEKRPELLQALKEIKEENPDIDFMISPITSEITIQVAGKVQIEIIENIIEERYKLNVFFDEAQVIYKETPIIRAQSMIRMIHDTNPFKASIGLQIIPAPIGSGIQFTSHISKGYLNASYQKAVSEGVLSGCAYGLYGWAVTDIEVVFYEGWYSSAQSSPADFRSLAPYVFRLALEKSATAILEPYNALQIITPMHFYGKVEHDILQMQGKILHVDMMEEEKITIHAKVPYRNSDNYIHELVNATKGMGICFAEIDSYQPLTNPVKPCNKHIPSILDLALLFQLRKSDEF